MSDDNTADDNTVNEEKKTDGNSQRILDGLWICACGGIIGEFIGIIAARWYLAAWMIWGGVAAGVGIGVLAVYFPFVGKAIYAMRLPFVWTSSYLFRSLKQLALSRQEVTGDVLKQRLTQYIKQRRWIAYENIIRRFLANSPVNSPDLAVRIYNVTKKIDCCRSQFAFLIWHVVGGLVFIFVSYRLQQSQQEFPALLDKVLPFLHDRLGNVWMGVVSDGLLVVLWFILISFAANMLLLFIRKKIIYWGSGWVMFACFLLAAFPLIQLGLSKVAEIDTVTEAIQRIPQGEKVFSTVSSSLPTAQYYLIVLSMLMFLRSLVLNTVANVGDQTKPSRLSLLIWAILLILTAQLPFGLYLPESVCFCVLLAITVMLNGERQTFRQRWSWLLVPFCCFFAVVLNLTLESGSVVLLAPGVALFIGGFLIVSEKSFHSLFTLAIYAAGVVFVGYFLRQYLKEPDTALTLLAVWSSVNLWQLLPHLDQFDARFSFFDRLQKSFLRRRLRNTEFGKESLLDTQWYKANAKQSPVPPRMPTQQPIPVPVPPKASVQQSIPVPPKKH